jgi:hypothetical protein
MAKVKVGWLRIFVLTLAIWSLFGIAVAVMIVYGMFNNVATSPAVMATAIGTGAAILSTLTGLAILGVVKRINLALDGQSS